MVGTLFFTLLAFLIPTITVYYIFFSLVRLLITVSQVRQLISCCSFDLCSLQALLWFGMAYLNYFPWYSIGRFMLDRGRFPGGIRFELLHSTNFVRKPAQPSAVQTPIKPIKGPVV